MVRSQASSMRDDWLRQGLAECGDALLDGTTDHEPAMREATPADLKREGDVGE